MFYPKQFIQKVFIEELYVLHKSNPYISFTLIAIGIEFLGKCLNIKEQDWNKGGSKENFERAIKYLNSFKEYREYLSKYKLWDSLRNGFAHSFVPKKTIVLSSKENPIAHFAISPNKEVINLRCENLYQDFKNSCIEITNMDFPEKDKMNQPFLYISSPRIRDTTLRMGN